MLWICNISPVSPNLFDSFLLVRKLCKEAIAIKNDPLNRRATFMDMNFVRMSTRSYIAHEPRSPHEQFHRIQLASNISPYTTGAGSQPEDKRKSTVMCGSANNVFFRKYYGNKRGSFCITTLTKSEWLSFTVTVCIHNCKRRLDWIDV